MDNRLSMLISVTMKLLRMEFCNKRYKPTLPDIQFGFRVGVMRFNATFNNISVILWPSVLLVEETGVPGENHRPAACY